MRVILTDKGIFFFAQDETFAKRPYCHKKQNLENRRHRVEVVEVIAGRTKALLHGIKHSRCTRINGSNEYQIPTVFNDIEIK